VAGQYIRLRGTGSRWKDRVWNAESVLRIGRVRDLEVHLDDESVSRRHAEVLFADGAWVVRDLGSTNGTLVNGASVGRVGRPLSPLDMLQLGNVILVVAEVGVGEMPADAGGTVLVCETAQQPWEEALESLATESTGLAGPGEQMRSLITAHHQLYQGATLEEVLRGNVRDAVIRVRAEYGALVLVEEETGRMAVGASYTTRPGAERLRAFNQALAQRCYSKGESLLCREEPPVGPSRRAGAPAGTQSIICALLRTPNRRLGVLYLERSHPQPEFLPADFRLADALAASMSAAIESTRGVERKQRDVFIQTVIALAQTVEMRDPYTGGHAQRVTDYSLLLAEELGLSEAECNDLRLGGPLHDIGKIGIDDAVLRKPSPLTPEEFEYMKTHTVKGVAILQTIPELAPILPIVRSHHERWDGKGYPDGLAGDRIPYLARVLAVADTFDAMTTDRPYRAGLGLADAIAEIGKGAGTQFDADCAAAFVRVRPRLEEMIQQRNLSATFSYRSIAGSLPLAGQRARRAVPR
jgi:HD-GYP domain-containing protein (c-di-GMP phosphodiesterase class II)